MQELINKVMNSAGVTEDQAKKSIEVVSGYIKEKMPGAFRDQIDNLTNGGSLSEGMKTKLNEVTGDLRDKAEDVIKEIREKAGEATEKLKGMIGDKK